MFIVFNHFEAYIATLTERIVTYYTTVQSCYCLPCWFEVWIVVFAMQLDILILMERTFFSQHASDEQLTATTPQQRLLFACDSHKYPFDFATFIILKCLSFIGHDKSKAIDFHPDV